MKYAILINSNGAYLVKEEGITDLEKAKARFHHWCEVYHNSEDLAKATIILADEQFDAVEGKKEVIVHEIAVAE